MRVSDRQRGCGASSDVDGAAMRLCDWLTTAAYLDRVAAAAAAAAAGGDAAAAAAEHLRGKQGRRHGRVARQVNDRPQPAPPTLLLCSPASD